MDLNPEQLAAVQTKHPNVVVTAAPGSGKSRVIIERIKHLIRSGVDPRAITAISFTVKSGRELQERLGPIQIGFCGNLHQLCLRLVRHCHESLSLPQVLTVIDEQTASDILAETVQEQGYKGTSDACRKALERGPFNFGDSVAMAKADLVAKAYYLKLFRAGMLDFDSLLHCALHLFRNQMAQQQVGVGTHVLVDEFQDSSVMDQCIYDVFPASNRFYVLDPRQSIYGFRGSNLKGAQALMQRSTVQCLSLTGNYRCGSEIVRVANKLIRHNGADLGNMVSMTGTEGWVCDFALPNQQEEMKEVAQRVIAARSLAGNSIAVLLRTNWLAEQFTLGLEAYGIQVARRVQASVEGWTQAKKVVAFASNPENDRLALEYLRMGSGGEGAAEIGKKLAREQLCSVNQVTMKIEQGFSGLDKLMFGARIDQFVLDGMNKLHSQLPPGSGPNDLLIAMNEIEANSVTTSDGIHVGTYHSYKGLEADCVILPAMEEATMPGTRKSDTPEDAEEARRLMYVAVTRARHSLILTHSATRKPQFGANEPLVQVPSRYIAEMSI